MSAFSITRKETKRFEDGRKNQDDKTIICGINMITPTAKAAIAINNTAAAAISLALPIRGLYCGDTLSAIASTAELMHSAAKTSPIHIIIMHHSIAEIPRTAESATAIIAAAMCILALCSSLKSIRIPLKANLNDRALSLHENCLSGIISKNRIMLIVVF